MDLHFTHGSRRGEQSHDGQGFGRDGRMTDIERLRQAIRDLHGVDSEHLRSESLREMFRREIAWEGTVGVFALKDHPMAQLAYAWWQETDEGGRRYFAVLGVDPIKSAQDAVRASIAAGAKQSRGDAE